MQSRERVKNNRRKELVNIICDILLFEVEYPMSCSEIPKSQRILLTCKGIQLESRYRSLYLRFV
jgi:hypothetical protein